MHALPKYQTTEKALVIGSGSLMCILLAEIRRQTRCKYQIAGIVAMEEPDEAGVLDYPVLGSIDELHRIICQHQPEVIIVAPSDGGGGLTGRQLIQARLLQNVRIVHAETVYEELTGKLPLQVFAPESIIYSNDFQPRRAALISNRLLSLGFAGVGLIVLAPIMLLIALLIRIDSAGPILFIQNRSGMAGRSFRLFKFRTMLISDKQESEWEEGNFHRITRVGRWLRKTRLDEIPQFLNIVIGDMNIVGPRPHPASNLDLFVLAARNTSDSGFPIPYYAIRSSVRPGITGWAQVRYRYANNLQEEMEKLCFDLYYLKHYSLWLDLRILFETAGMVFSRADQLLDQPSDQPLQQPLAVSRVVNPSGTGELRVNKQALQTPSQVKQSIVRSRDVA